MLLGARTNNRITCRINLFFTAIGIVVFALPTSLRAQVKELEIKEEPVRAVAVEGFPDNCYAIIHSDLPVLNFEATLGIDKIVQRNKSGDYTLILPAHQKQKIRVVAENFKEERLTIPKLGPGLGIVFTISVKSEVERQGTATILLRSEPAGAEVRIEGLPDFKAETPCSLDVPARDYSVVFSRNYYQTSVIQVHALKGCRIDTTVRLAPGAFDLVINSNPPGAKVSFDTTDATGATPIESSRSSFNLDTGEHLCTFELAGYKKAEQRFRVDPDRVTEVTVDLEARKGLSIVSVPEGAYVSGLGNACDSCTTPLQDLELPGGRYHVRVSKTGYLPEDRDIYIGDNSAAAQEFVLTPEVADTMVRLRKHLDYHLHYGWLEYRGSGGIAPTLLFTPGGSIGLSPGTLFKTPLFFKMSIFDPNRLVSMLAGISLFGDAYFGNGLILLDAIGVQGGFLVQNKMHTSRLYCEIDGRYGIGAISKTVHVIESIRSYPRDTTWADTTLTNTYVISPFQCTLRYERSFISHPHFSLIAEIGGVLFSGTADPEAPPEINTEGFMPYCGIGVRIHAKFFNMFAGMKEEAAR